MIMTLIMMMMKMVIIPKKFTRVRLNWYWLLGRSLLVETLRTLIPCRSWAVSSTSSISISISSGSVTRSSSINSRLPLDINVTLLSIAQSTVTKLFDNNLPRQLALVYYV